MKKIFSFPRTESLNLKYICNIHEICIDAVRKMNSFGALNRMLFYLLRKGFDNSFCEDVP